MSTLVETAKTYAGAETPRRREQAAERINQIKAKYGPGGGWKLLQPGPLWEACEIWLDETRQFGLAIIDHVLQQGGRSLGPGDVEPLRRFMYDWAQREQEDYIMPGFETFMAERGIKVPQQVGNIREQVEYRIAQMTKEFLMKIFEAGRARAA
jgi:hypothetical protein